MKFATDHEELIHDISYDYYGKRLATCSSDMKIKIWNINEQDGTWVLNDSWKAHDSSILRVIWAHPEFGQVIASCGFDRTVRIWEEQETAGGRRWTERSRLTDSRGSIQSIEFAPSHLGLKIATCGSDGVVRIYEAMDFINLAQWTLMDEFDILPSSGLAGGAIVSKETDGQYCLSWCPSRYLSPMLAVGCGKENTAKIFRPDVNNKWHACEILKTHTDIVTDIAWAPNLGKSYHLIATACRDQHVRIFKVTDESMSKDRLGGESLLKAKVAPQGEAKSSMIPELSKKRYLTEVVGDFVEHRSEVWKVEWNITGTILSSSGDDGTMRLWKSSFVDDWRCIGVVSPSI